MPDEDAKIFNEAFRIYNKYRWTEMRTDSQWIDLSNEVRDFAEKYHWRTNQLAAHMGYMLLEVFNDLYKNGKKPEIPDYFGRDDL